jgi:TonB family protein
MIFRDLRFLFAAAAWVCTSMAAAASPDLERLKPPTSCEKPDYPKLSLKLEEEGVSSLGFLVRADGTVGRSVILNSSGSRTLDQAALDALSKCLFKPATVGGKAVDMWVPIAYYWYFDDDPEMSRSKRATAIAATKGNVASRYQLSLLILSTAKTVADRERAVIVLRSAADLGHAHAQYDLGRRYEKGDGMSVDLEEAMRWYQKAAAQGDVIAIQRLAEGALQD